jgi:hypothetical protein
MQQFEAWTSTSLERYSGIVTPVHDRNNLLKDDWPGNLKERIYVGVAQQVRSACGVCSMIASTSRVFAHPPGATGPGTPGRRSALVPDSLSATGAVSWSCGPSKGCRRRVAGLQSGSC